MTLAEHDAAMTPGRWYVDGPEFGGIWVVTTAPEPQDSFAVHPRAKGQPYAVLVGQGDADAAGIAALRNALPLVVAALEAARRYRDAVMSSADESVQLELWARLDDALDVLGEKGLL